MTENIARLGKANSFCDVCSLPVKQHDKLKDVAWRKHSQWCKRVWQRICSDSTAVSQIEDQCTESQHFSQAILSVFLISLAFLKTPCAWIQETSFDYQLRLHSSDKCLQVGPTFGPMFVIGIAIWVTSCLPTLWPCYKTCAGNYWLVKTSCYRVFTSNQEQGEFRKINGIKIVLGNSGTINLRFWALVLNSTLVLPNSFQNTHGLHSGIYIYIK